MLPDLIVKKESFALATAIIGLNIIAPVRNRMIDENISLLRYLCNIFYANI